MRVRLRCGPDALGASVIDDGSGFDAERADGALRLGHLGLQAMRDRVAAVSGTLTIESSPQSGTTVQVHVPGAGQEGVAAS